MFKDSRDQADLTTARAADEAIDALRQREKKLDTLNRAAVKFLSQSEETFVDTMTSGVGLIADMTHFDRVSVWRNFMKQNGMHTAQVYRWNRKSGGTTAPNEKLTDITYSRLVPRWEEIFAAGGSINNLARNLPEYDVLKSFGVVSMLANPVFINNAFWGFVLYERDREIVFEEDAVDILRSASLMMAATVNRNEQAALYREADERAKLMLDATPITCQLWDRNFKTIDCNEAAVKLYELKDKQEYIDKFFDLSPEYQPDGQRSIEKARFYIEKAFAEGGCVLDWMHRKLDGTPMPMEITLVPLKYGDDYVIAAYQRDMREHNRMMDEINTALLDATEANRSKSEFLANMSHEIRTPMNAIMGITEILLQDETLASKVKEALTKVYNSGDLLLNIINDILDLSKIEAGKLELTPFKYETASLINDAATLNMMRIGSKQIEFQLSVDENTPSALVGDELRIKQILNNLLSNAFKYTEKGHVKLSVSAEKEGDEKGSDVTLVFSVSDTGQGMTKEQISKIFDEYSRFNLKANRTTEGTGLGMSITQNLIGLMNGSITVESEVNKGSLFTVRLPQKTAGGGVLGKELAESLQKFRTSGAKQIKRARVLFEPMPYGSVLIVDDVESNLYVAEGLLAPYGLSVETVMSGLDAIDKIKGGMEYDIVFMDHMMPRMDGIEATKTMREHGYTRPIVALTANAVVGQSDMFLANGFDGFISKPIDVRQLNAVLKKFVRGKHSPETVEAARRQEAGRMGQAVDETPHPPISKRLAELFIRDASRALATLEAVLEKRGGYEDDDIRAYTVSVHAMKSSLAHVGETELSAVAAGLEQAGRDKNTAVMSAETGEFLDNLRAVVEKITLLKNS
jgi:signal transduction histidine kinase/CheY-like chemotaxis protein/HPt (histidine-containing phosphotransfer) domain-containing protein